jgi:hypothetical protein
MIIFTDSNQSTLDDDATDVMTLQKRLLLHDRVDQLCDLRLSQLTSKYSKISLGKYLYVEPFWLEKYMDAFSECEDWAWMLKSSIEFRSKNN